jgi:hypothetical protein
MRGEGSIIEEWKFHSSCTIGHACLQRFPRELNPSDSNSLLRFLIKVVSKFTLNNSACTENHHIYILLWENTFWTIYRVLLEHYKVADCGFKKKKKWFHTVYEY